MTNTWYTLLGQNLPNMTSYCSNLHTWTQGGSFQSVGKWDLIICNFMEIYFMTRGNGLHFVLPVYCCDTTLWEGITRIVKKRRLEEEWYHPLHFKFFSCSKAAFTRVVLCLCVYEVVRLLAKFYPIFGVVAFCTTKIDDFRQQPKKYRCNEYYV